MNRRKLGNSGMEIAPLALGGNVFGWTIDEKVSFEVLDAFVAAGFNFIDTADVYSRWAPGNRGGESETIIGNWLKRRGQRERVIVATKVGMEMGADQKGLSKAYILKAVEQSLRRLQTDYIDLYQAHTDDTSTPLEETLEAFTELMRAGKVRAIGASNYSAERLFQAVRTCNEHGFPTYQSLQPLYNLYDRAAFEEKLEPLCQELEIGVIPYYSLASGFLTGKYRSEADLGKSARGQGVRKYLNERGARILTALGEVAARYEATPAQVALAWLLSHRSVTAPIASATSVGQLTELVAGVQLELDGGAVDTLNRASALPAAS